MNGFQAKTKGCVMQSCVGNENVLAAAQRSKSSRAGLERLKKWAIHGVGCSVSSRLRYPIMSVSGAPSVGLGYRETRRTDAL